MKRAGAFRRIKGPLTFSILAILGASAQSARAENQEKTSAQSDAQQPASKNDSVAKPPPRQASTDLSLVWVPWGMHYTRAGWGATFTHRVPLVRKNGILWDSTNIAVGVRDFYGYVNNTFGPFLEITPIAFFKFRVEAGYDYFIHSPFNGGMRVLTPLGEQRLAAGQFERDNKSALDWTNNAGMDNRANFTAPINIGGTRLRLMPTLQGKVGAFVFQYNFTADFNFYHAPGATNKNVYHDSFTFTLRKLQDISQTHELLLAYSVPMQTPGELLIGLSTRYNRVQGTGLDQLAMMGLVFARFPRKILKGKVSPFAAVQAGTLLVDPLWQYAFSWLTVVGADINLQKSKPYHIPTDKP